MYITEIEKLREKLHSSIDHCDTKELLKISQLLDREIVKYLLDKMNSRKVEMESKSSTGELKTL